MSQATFTIISIFIISSFIKSHNVPIYAYLTSLSIVSVLAIITYQHFFSNKAILNSEEVIEDEPSVETDIILLLPFTIFPPM